MSGILVQDTIQADAINDYVPSQRVYAKLLPLTLSCSKLAHYFNLFFRSISLEEIISRLMKGYVAIVLVNSNALICNWCEVYSLNKLRMLANCICPSTQSEYCGHYIVLCGFDADKRCVYYKNPSFNDGLCCTKFDMFESARHSYGTDDDIIFIKLQEPQLNVKETFINNSNKI